MQAKTIRRKTIRKMDNLFDYLIILFFIVSALTSLLKKKKPQNQQDKASEAARKEEIRVKHEQMRQEPGTKTMRRSLDPFDTDVNVFGQPKQTDEKSEVDRYFEEALKKSGQQDTSMQKPVEVDDEFHDATEKKSAQEKVTALTSIKSEYLEAQKRRSLEDRMRDIRQSGIDYDIDELKKETDFRLNTRAAKVKELLKNKQNLREIIIVNELLNKPKALRR